MADEQNTPAPEQEAKGTVTQIGSTMRFEADAQPTLEEQAAALGEKPSTEETPKPEATQEEPPKDAKAEITDEVVKAAVEETTKGMAPEMAEKVTPFVESFAKNGTLTDAEVTEAAKAVGLTEAMVRQYMAGAQVDALKGEAAQAQLISTFHGEFGGAEQFAAFQQWSTDTANLDSTKAAQINRLLDSEHPEDALPLVLQAKAAWEATGAGTPARDITKVNSGAANVQAGFQSAEEQSAAINDRRYGTDAKYRTEVDARIVASAF